MDEKRLKDLLEKVKGGNCSVSKAMQALKHWPSESLDFACLDHHRTLRTGFPEVIFGENKSADQITAILRKMMGHGSVAMATRVNSEKAGKICAMLENVTYHEAASMLTAKENTAEDNGRGTIGILAAGTSDIPVAEEAFVTAQSLGNRVEKAYDVGVAGIHRLMAHKELLQTASVLVVVAGMEGALPSVVGGMVSRPVVAVPTSIGYGTGLGGIAALLGMLNSCAPGVAVVNIDNGFGAGCIASAINRK